MAQGVDIWIFCQQNEMVGRTIYFLHMTFVLMVMPVFAPFSLTANLHATWVGIGKYGNVTSVR